MFGVNEINNLINLIDKYYYFNENKHIWDQIKEKILETSKKNVFSVREIDQYLSEMGDMHLRLYDLQKANRINCAVVENIDGKLYLFHEEKRKEIESINQEKVNVLVENYKKMYPKFKKTFWLNQIIQDIKMCKGIFDVEQVTFVLKDGTESTYIAVNSEKTLELFHNSELSMLKPIFCTLIDADTVLIKIITFNIKDIDVLFEEVLNDKSVIEASNIIFDIRDNCGGKIELAKKIVSQIIQSDIEYPFCIKNRKGDMQSVKVKATPNFVLKDKNIMVFINQNTMSSSEYIFAAGLRAAYKSEVLFVGEETYGLSGQASVHKIGTDCVLYLTEKRYFTYDGKEVLKGIEPDYFIKSNSLFEKSEDYYISWYKDRKRGL